MKDEEKTHAQLCEEMKALRQRNAELEHTIATYHERLEVDLREHEERFRQIIEDTEAGYFFIDRAGMFRQVNAAWLRLHGYASADEILGKHFSMTQVDTDLEGAHGNVEIALAGAPIPSGEFARRCKDGSIGYHTFTIRPVMKKGEIIGLEGFIIDTTEQKRMADKLRESERKFRGLYTAMTEGVILHEMLYDASGRAIDYLILDVNPRFEQITGIRAEHAIGKLASEVYGTSAAPYLDIYAEVAHTGKPAAFETYFPPMDKHFHISVFSPENGKFATVFTDITQRKRTEVEILRFNTELEQRVHQRTVQLKAANKDVENFAYAVSHDLKAPLRGISSLTSWIRTDYAMAFDKRGQEMLDLIINRAKRMDSLIEGILRYSHLGHVNEPKKELNLNLLVHEVIDLLTPPAHIHITLDNELPVILAERTRIFEVFQNLLGNAVKFLDKPQGTITIRCDEIGAHWQFSVTDNGPGIDPKYHNKIFQIFQTLKPRDEFESTGIGLSIVKKIVEFYGGRIWVESEVGKGSTFRFTFPKQGGR